jgi:hypothetical protein
LTDKGFALWSAPLEHFWLDGLVIMTSPAFARLPQGHSVAALAAFRSVADPVVDAFAYFLPFQSTTEDPGAPFECLGLDLAPGHISEWNYRT